MKLTKEIKQEIVNLYTDTNMMYKDMADYILDKYNIVISKATCKSIVERNTDYRRPRRNDYKYKVNEEVKQFIERYVGTNEDCQKEITEKFDLTISTTTICKYRIYKSRIYYSKEEQNWLFENVEKLTMNECIIQFEKKFGRKINPRKFAERNNLRFIPIYKFTDDMLDILMANIELGTDEITKRFKEVYGNNKNSISLRNKINELKKENKKEIHNIKRQWLIENKPNYYNWEELTKAFNERFGTNHNSKYFIKGSNKGCPFIKNLNTPFKSRAKRKYYTPVINARNVYENYHNEVLGSDETVFCLDGNKNNLDINNLIKIKHSLATQLKVKGYLNELAMCYINMWKLKRVMKGLEV